MIVYLCNSRRFHKVGVLSFAIIIFNEFLMHEPEGRIQLERGEVGRVHMQRQRLDTCIFGSVSNGPHQGSSHEGLLEILVALEPRIFIENCTLLVDGTGANEVVHEVVEQGFGHDLMKDQVMGHPIGSLRRHDQKLDHLRDLRNPGWVCYN